ncbi:MAG TPA: 2-oxo acid dehydrogenase subunit E2 [Desulfuromonadales bacterium]|nr:2-oxo acid dehydrogenase subunit E2 [Desulfuromonadales bacterium]
MATEIIMPKLSDTMTEGLFACWKKSVGDRIERGDIIAEVETDKAVMDLEAFTSGTLLNILVHGGETVPVGTVLGLIGEAEEQPDQHPVTAAAEAEIATVASPPSRDIQLAVAALSGGHDHEKSSPLVRRLAREQGINLERVTGSGPEGRITQEDLTIFAGLQNPSKTASEPGSFQPAIPVVSAEPATSLSMRQAVAATVSRSWQTIPHFSVTVEIDMQACSEIVNELKQGPHPVGYNALVIKACAATLQKFPLLCSADSSSLHEININFAVAHPEGVMMPIIRNCQHLPLAEIENNCSRLAEKCQKGRLSTDEMERGSFSVSNLGMYGVDAFTALIMPGQTAILAVGAVKRRPAVCNDQLVVAATMRVTLCSDHRAIDGAYAASFLAALRSALEKPVALLM